MSTTGINSNGWPAASAMAKPTNDAVARDSGVGTLLQCSKAQCDVCAAHLLACWKQASKSPKKIKNTAITEVCKLGGN